MHNYNMLFKINFILNLFLLASCSPLKEKLPIKPLVELEYVDPNLVEQNSSADDHAVIGNMALEVQQDLSTNKTNVYATVTFHEPETKNVLFDKIRTNALSKNIYKPKPPPTEPPPCGIPGFPDCPTNITTNKTLTKREQIPQEE